MPLKTGQSYVGETDIIAIDVHVYRLEEGPSHKKAFPEFKPKNISDPKPGIYVIADDAGNSRSSDIALLVREYRGNWSLINLP